MLQAEPGAGKTTRVPLALLEAGIPVEGELLVAQPRRLAARMAAARVASTIGEPVGGRVGYQVRFDTRAGPDTRIRFVTEGILARRLRDDPTLRGVGLVILDEFHERHIDADVCLALLKRLGSAVQVGVMSATLDPDPVAAYLGGVALRCPGRAYPVEVEHQPNASIASALRSLAPLHGSVLVFLPGAREIREAANSCGAAARQLGLEVVSLYGDLPAAAQDRAVDTRGGPKLILATNVAETSITIDGIAAVIDTGLARRPSHNPWTGIPTLQLAKISRASAQQRAGRAGRTQAGRCVRLYPTHDLDRRPAYDAPELARLDLAGAMLGLRAADIVDPRAVDWFESPPEPGVDAAEALLRMLGAVDDDGSLAAIGRRMLRYPAHPRLARLLDEAAARGIPELGAGAAALLSERPVRRHHGARTDRVAAADVIADLDDLEHAPHELDTGAVRAVQRVRKQFRRLLDRSQIGPRPRDPEDALCQALLVAFGDRVGRVRGRELVFAAGGSAQLADDCVVKDADYAVALGVEERRSGTRARTLVRSAAQVEADWILELLTDSIEERVAVTFDTKRERVQAVDELAIGALVLERSAVRGTSPSTTSALRDAALAKGPAHFVEDSAALAALMARTQFAATHDPTVSALTEGTVAERLASLCDGLLSFAQLRAANLLSHLRADLPGALARLAPEHVKLAGGRRLAVHYEPDRAPWVQSRLQDFFGTRAGPAVAGGRVPLVLHLLAPNRRAVQVTTDLEGFWERHYPALRRTLMRRYPKHAWPEDPLTATPPSPRGKRRRR